VKPCGASDLTLETRRKGLRFLSEVTLGAQQEQHLKALLANGTVPGVPKLWEGAVGTETSSSTAKWQGTVRGSTSRGARDSSEQASPSEIMLHWGAVKGDSVSFFSLEFAGPAMGTTRTLKYREIFRDPEDASPESEFRYSRLIKGLSPGTTYAFRIRGFNGFGPGDYTYKTFTTRPAAPACPRITSLASDAVTLRWVFSDSFFKHVEELKRIFQQTDADQSGAVSREELIAALGDTGPGSCSAELKAFLTKVAQKVGLDVSQGYGALFDMMEGDDDGTISWAEFECFFMSAGWTQSGSVAGSVRGSINTFHTSATPTKAKATDAPSGMCCTILNCIVLYLCVVMIINHDQ
jgi:EF hand